MSAANGAGPSEPTGDSVQLVGAGRHAYLLVGENPAAGAGYATSSLYVSDDAGGSWRLSRGRRIDDEYRDHDPCPEPRHGENDASRLVSAPGGELAVECVPRPVDGPVHLASVVVSTDRATSFRRRPGSVRFAWWRDLAGVAGDGLLFSIAEGDLTRSPDGGRSWQVVVRSPDDGDERDTPIQFRRRGFGWWLDDHGHVYLTRDGGAHWRRTNA